MKDIFVSFEVAKLLKKKGFNLETDHFYDSNGRLDGDFTTESYPAPTQSLVKLWLILTYNICIVVDIHLLNFLGKTKWMYTIEKFDDTSVDYIISQGDENDKHIYNTYDEALENALIYSLNNLIPD